MYKCSKCGIEVIVYSGKIFTPCKCNATIIAEASAVTKGKGAMRG